LPHHHELRQGLPEEPESFRGNCRTQAEDGRAADLGAEFICKCWPHLTSLTGNAFRLFPTIENDSLFRHGRHKAGQDGLHHELSFHAFLSEALRNHARRGARGVGTARKTGYAWRRFLKFFREDFF
jgi:hypothetical protein